MATAIDWDNLPSSAAEFEEKYGSEPDIGKEDGPRALLAFAAKVEKDCSWVGLYLWVKAAIKEKQIKKQVEDNDDDDDDDDDDDEDDSKNITKFNDLLHEEPSDALFLKLDRLFTDTTAISSRANLEAYIQGQSFPMNSDNEQVQMSYANNMDMIVDAVNEGDQDSLDVWDVAGAAIASRTIRHQHHVAKIEKLHRKIVILKRKLAEKQEEPKNKTRSHD